MEYFISYNGEQIIVQSSGLRVLVGVPNRLSSLQSGLLLPGAQSATVNAQKQIRDLIDIAKWAIDANFTEQDFINAVDQLAANEAANA